MIVALLKIQRESKLGNINIQKFISFSHHLRKKNPLITSKNGINKNNATAIAFKEGNTKLNILNIKFAKNKTVHNAIKTRFSNGWFLRGLKNLNNCFMKFPFIRCRRDVPRFTSLLERLYIYM
jgi:hypothetical protein